MPPCVWLLHLNNFICAGEENKEIGTVALMEGLGLLEDAVFYVALGFFRGVRQR